MRSKNTYRFISGSLLAVSIAAIIIWILIFPGENVARFWHAFLINFLFFTSAAAGLVTIPAMIFLAYGKWMGDLERIARTGLSFSIPSILALIALWWGSSSWAPWVLEEVHQEIWLNNTFLFSRNIVLLVIFWIMAFLFIQNREKESFRVWAGWLAITFVITFSVMGFDFVMALEPEWYSMMTGGYFFVSSMYIAISLWILMSLLFARPSKDQLHDVGKLLIAFCMITTYLMYSHLMPIWYENIPHETVFLVPRMNLAWKPVSYALLILVYIGPIIFLLPARVKRNPYLIGSLSVMIFFGMWIERWWLVSAVFNWEKVVLGLPEILTFIAFGGIMISGILLSINFISSEQQTREQLS